MYHTLKYMKRAGIYKGPNVTFDPKLIEARSYQHWVFVSKIDGKVIFNHHSYSMSTNKHQTKVRNVLNDLGINIDIEVDSSPGLQATGWKSGCIKNAQETIELLERKEAKGRKGTWASENRLAKIAEYEQMIKNVKGLKD